MSTTSSIVVPVFLSTSSAIHLREENRVSAGSRSTSSTVVLARHSEVVSPRAAAVVYNLILVTVLYIILVP